MERWKDKVAIVTGASAGIGAAIAESLVEYGLKVVAIARGRSRLHELSEKFNNLKLLGTFNVIQADIREEKDVIKAFKWVTDNLGPIYILINNAGVGKPISLIDGDIVDFKSIFETNVLGLTIATKETVKNMMENHVEGHIIHINCVVGHYVANVPNMNVYPASKYAVTALAETLRHELNMLSSKIKVTSISPGLVHTEMFATNGYLNNKETETIFNLLPKLSTKDVADAVLYVLGTPPSVQVTELTIRPVGEIP